MASPRISGCFFPSARSGVKTSAKKSCVCARRPIPTRRASSASTASCKTCPSSRKPSRAKPASPWSAPTPAASGKAGIVYCSSMTRVCSAALLALPLAAQWMNYPTPGIPRTKDGKPNLSAPAPRTTYGKPDLSGVWYLQTQGCGPDDGCADYVGGPEFGNIGARLPGGLPYQPWAADLVKQRSAGIGKDDPVALCRPSGVVRLLTFPPPRKIIQLPNLVVILSERDVTFQQIFL